MILEQFYLSCLSQASYLIADEGSGRAAIVDPRRDVGIYLDACRERGLTLGDVLLTHFHADFLAGHLELRERTGATIRLGAEARADYDFVPMADGEELVLGPNVTLRALATPGHTPESTCYLVVDTSGESQRPHAVLTGDTLFIGDVGRPDLLASIGVTAEELARNLHRSLREKLLPLPDHVLVYPGHGAGSACGRSLSSETVSTIGEQRRLNYALQPMDEERFVQLVASDQPEAPGYFAHDADLNRRKRETLDRSLGRALRPLPLEAVLALVNEGAQLLDSRDAAAFAAGHLEGSLNVGLGGRFAGWAGTLLTLERPIVLVTEPGREEETAVRLGRIGFDHVQGYLEDGFTALSSRPDLVRVVRRLEPEEAARELEGDDPPVVLDVRGPGEHAQGSLPGSLLVPLPQLARRLDEVPSSRRVLVACASGYRSSAAVSLLERNGYQDVADLVGGLSAWNERVGA